MHLTSSPLDWYVVRAAGVAAYVLLTAGVLLGLTMARKKSLRLWPKFALEDVHRFTGLLVGSFVAVHVVSIAIDSWLPFSIPSLVVPLVSRYRPVWVALGIVGAELLVALAVTNHYRDRLSYKFWRRAHYLNLAVWTAATLHGVGSGTDRSTPWLLAVYAAATAAVGTALTWRLTRRRLAFAGVAGAAVAAGVVGLAVGPLQFRPRPWNAVSFSESLSGHIAQLNGVTRGIVSMAGEGAGTQRVLVRADLLIRPGRIERTAFQMEYLPSGLRCSGAVTKVAPFGFEAVCRLPNRTRRVVTAEWHGTGIGQELAGTISSHA
jgi:sulfoxide reductase heme-binding subunit YedZ